MQLDAPQSLREPLAALSAKLETWAVTGVELLPNVVVAVVILAVAFVSSRVAARWLCRGLARTSLSDQLVGLAEGLFRLGVLSLGVVLALDAMHLDRAVATALAGVGVVGLALGFAFQDVAANLISGVFMAVKRPFEVGHVIETNGFIGTVERLGLRATEIRRFTGELVLLPNRKIFSEAMVNVSAARFRRVDLKVGVSYADDLDEVERITLEALETVTDVDRSRAPMVLFQDFGSSSVDLELRFWVPYGEDPMSFLRGRSEAIKAIRRAFDREGLTIPFPIRTLDFGISGGVPLRRELERAS